MVKLWLLFLLPFCTSLTGTYDYDKVLATGYRLYWSILPDTEEIAFAMTADTTGWVALGVSTNGNMNDADIWLGWATGASSGVLYDYYSTSSMVPSLDSSQDVTFVAAREAGAKTEIEFKRKFDTSHNVGNQDRIVNPYLAMTFIYALLGIVIRHHRRLMVVIAILQLMDLLQFYCAKTAVHRQFRHCMKFRHHQIIF